MQHIVQVSEMNTKRLSFFFKLTYKEHSFDAFWFLSSLLLCCTDTLFCVAWPKFYAKNYVDFVIVHAERSVNLYNSEYKEWTSKWNIKIMQSNAVAHHHKPQTALNQFLAFVYVFIYGFESTRKPKESNTMDLKWVYCD